MRFQGFAFAAAAALAAMPVAQATSASTRAVPDAQRASATGANGTTSPHGRASSAGESSASATRSVASHDPTARQQAALAAARKGTGASRVHAEEQEHMPVPQTGM
jgi:hypothetical protein